MSILSNLSQANKAYSTLTRKVEAVIIEVSMVEVLMLRTYPQRVYKTKYLPHTKVTYSHIGFHNFSIKILVIAEPGHIQFV